MTDPCHCPHCGRAINSFQPVRDILREVAESYGMTVAELVSDNRQARMTFARAKFYYRAVTETSASITKIAIICGDRDHTTVRNGIEMYCYQLGLPVPRMAVLSKRIRRRRRRIFEPTVDSSVAASNQ